VIVIPGLFKVLATKTESLERRFFCADKGDFFKGLLPTLKKSHGMHPFLLKKISL
jgi:hypothetical protein